MSIALMANVFSAQTRSTGRWYAELEVTAVATADIDATTSYGITVLAAPAADVVPWEQGVGVQADGQAYVNDVPGPSINQFAGNDIVSVAFDADTGEVWFATNNIFDGDPAAGTGEVNPSDPLVGSDFKVFFSANLNLYTGGTGAAALLKAKGSQQTYSPPTGFLPWEDE